jgi:hypothetical protein
MTRLIWLILLGLSASAFGADVIQLPSLQVSPAIAKSGLCVTAQQAEWNQLAADPDVANLLRSIQLQSVNIVFRPVLTENPIVSKTEFVTVKTSLRETGAQQIYRINILHQHFDEKGAVAAGKCDSKFIVSETTLKNQLQKDFLHLLTTKSAPAPKTKTTLGMPPEMPFLMPPTLPKTSAVPPNEKDLVFGIEGTLIQEVPKASIEKYNKDSLITVGSHYYRVADHAVQAIRRLAAEPGVSVSFFSEFSLDETNKILSDISKQKPGGDLGSIAKKVLSREDLVPHQDDGKPEDSYVPKVGQKDLLKICPDLSKVILIDDNTKATIPTQEGNLFYPIHPSYEFESFSAASAELEKIHKADPKVYEAKKKFFPATEDEWKQHQNRMDAIYSVLEKSIEEVNTDSKKNFTQTVQSESKTPFDQLIKDGQTKLNSVLS